MTPDQRGAWRGKGALVKVDLSTAVPRDATAIVVKFFAESNGGSPRDELNSLSVRSKASPEEIVAMANDAVLDGNADWDTNTASLPVPPDRRLELKWTTDSCEGSSVGAFLTGYVR